jgi:hypothetical protein
MTSSDPWDTPGTTGPPGSPEPSGPSDRLDQPEQPGRPGGPGGPAPDSPGAEALDGPDAPDLRDGESPDEAALRELMRRAVGDLRPAPGALDHLRRAVPARRQHRRQALAGSVAALLLAGAAVPALVHAAGSGGTTTAAPAGRTDTHTSRPGEDGRHNALRPSADPGWDGRGRDQNGSGQPTLTDGSQGPSAHAVSPSTTVPADAPPCSADQLGNGTSKAGSPDAYGQVYGWFRVANVSGSACAMPAGTGTVQVHLLSSTADPSRISVVDHTAGDPADRLPTVDSTVPVVLAPGQAYEVAYAWVPAGTGSGGCTTQPSSPPPSATATPTPTDTAATSGAAAASVRSASVHSGGSGGAGSPATEVNAAGSAPADTAPGGTSTTGPSTTSQPTGFTLLQSSTADGPVVVGPTVKDACAGTVYTTPPMARTPDVTTP